MMDRNPMNLPVDAATTEEQCEWRKTGGGSLRIGKRIIKPNQRFTAKESEIPKAFRDTVIKLSGSKSDGPINDFNSPPIESLTSSYSLKEKPNGWYDIVDQNGKVINEKSLRKEPAEEMLRSLSE